ncbi:MAG: Flp pilus assembly protein CpaB [Acidobacteria bacterium]|nr:Flp pilus assembly protein CpaB [Acidobacteriota bacterium]
MKRNLVPLLGIAFVVAVATTGIFYGLFVGRMRDSEASAAKNTIVVAARSIDRGRQLDAADLKLSPWAGALPPGAYQRVEDVVGKTVYRAALENEPITEERTAVEASKGESAGIAKGMRAISVRISESNGLMPFLRAGHRVDLQVINLRGNEPAVRTLLQNAEVLSVQGSENNGQGAVPVVNLLVEPQDADRVALADSAARVRLLLRNQSDDAQTARPAVEFRQVLLEQMPRGPVRTESAPAAAPAAVPASVARVDLEVKLVNGRASFFEENQTRLTGLPQEAAVRIATLQRGVASEAVIRPQELLSKETLRAADQSTVTVRAGATWKAANGNACGLRIQLLPKVSGSGAVRLRVEPEMTMEWGQGSTTRRVAAEVDLADGQTMALSGFGRATESAHLLQKLFGGRINPGASQDLVVLITPRVMAPMVQAAR